MSNYQSLSVIREYNVGDAEYLIKAINSVCREQKWMHTNEFVPTIEWKDALSVSNQKHLILVVAVDQKIVGWCRIFVTGYCGEVGIGLLKECRDMKIGTRLLNRADEWSMSRCLSTLKLSCRHDNKRALHLFTKFGFRACHDVNDVAMLNMVKTAVIYD